MRRNVKMFFKIALQIGLWLFVFCLGINIIAKGMRIIYKEVYMEVVESCVEGLVERIYLWQGDIYESRAASLPTEELMIVENDIPVISYLPPIEEETTAVENMTVEETPPREEPAAEVIYPVMTPNIIGNEYTLAQLKDFDFLLRKFYAVESNTTVDTSLLNVVDMLSKDMSLEANDAGNAQILIYHTHATESYIDSREGVVEDTVVGMGAYLADILEKNYGYEVLHITTPFDSIEGKLDRSAAYAYAEDALEGILVSYPDIEVIIDLHRDGVDEDVHLVTEYNGKKAAKIMFVNGISRMETEDIDYLYNPYVQDNLSFSLQLQLKGEAYFPNLMRRIIVKAYRYNLHFEPRSVLVELGAQTNTVEEARNAVELLAVMLGEVLK